MKNWYEAKTGNHQGLIIDENTGKNIAVVYDKADAPLIAAAPSMYDALAAIANMQTQETTEWWELATLCISIAKIEIAKLEGRS